MTLNSIDMVREKKASTITMDTLEKIKYLDSDRSDRTVWIHPIQNINMQNLKRFFEITWKVGIVLDTRIRRGKKYPNRMADNLFGFVEFADTMSVNRALHLAAQKVTMIDGVKFRIYKAGTGTFIFSKKTSKQKKLEVAKNNLPPVPYNNINPGQIRGFVNRGPRRPVMARGRGRGRGRGRVRGERMERMERPRRDRRD